MTYALTLDDVGMSLDLTGNDYLSICRIHANGAVDGINVLHAGLAGLVEWRGSDDTPLLSPEFTLDGTPISLHTAAWRRVDRWIPTFSVTADNVTIAGTICAPVGYPPARGLFLRYEFENHHRAPRKLDVALLLHWASTVHCIASVRPLAGYNRVTADSSLPGVLLESDGARGPALAIVGDRSVSADAANAHGEQGTPLRARLTQSLTLPPNKRISTTFYLGAGRERDGAVMAATVLRRVGADQWLRQARLELSHILRAAQDHRWAELLNRNLLFNRFFAVARAIDDDRLYHVRSRVTTAGAPALFNEREALLWSLPALIIADPALAREALFRVFETFSERSGEYLRYVDGGAYDAGFSLDQFLLYGWAAAYYVNATNDEAVLDEPLLRQIVQETDIAAFTRLHAQHLLASTELLPSGDLADYPYTTTANVLLWAFSNTLEKFRGESNDDVKLRFDGAASEIAAAIWQHCVTDVGGEALLTSSTNLEGDAAVYDDPALSLALLPFFGFCKDDDPVWRATMSFLRSHRYPLYRGGAAPGVAQRTDPTHARLAALCADLLGPNSRAALDALLQLRLPAGVAAAAYDATSGEVVEPYHAALAGFLAWALVRTAEPLDQGTTGRKRRR